MDGDAEPDFLTDEVHDGSEASLERQLKRKPLESSFFTLSGGILKRDTRTSNRIDSLLMKMIESGPGTVYSPKIDKNLDYLHTSLQLDMISIFASSYRPREDLRESEHDPLE